jgi:DNA repair photolyase
MQETAIEQIPVTAISPNPDNVRMHSTLQVERLAKSIQTFGFNIPIVVDGSNMLIAGHGRLEAAKQIGLETVPAIRVTHLTPEQIRAFMLADNKLTEMGEWDNKRLAEELQALMPSLSGMGMTMPDIGFSEKDIALLGHMLGDKASPEFAEQSNEGEMGSEIAANTDQQSANSTCAISGSATDIGTGPCPHRCVYCFIRNSKAGASQRQFKAATMTSIEAVVERAKEFGFVTVGNTSDPMIRVFKPQLHRLFSCAIKHNVTLEMQTKDPQALLDEAEAKQFPMELLSVKSSFSFFDDDRGKVAEPGCKPPSTRITALASLKQRGAEISIRWQPCYLGYEYGFAEALDSIRPDLVFVEPLRVGATTRAHNEKIAPCLTEDKQDFDVWLKRWYQTDSDGKLVMVNAMHYYVLRHNEAREEYTRIKALVNGVGAKFSICSCENSLFALDMMEGPGWACSTPRRILNKWKYDSRAIHSRAPERRMAELIPRHFLNAPEGLVDTEIERLYLLLDPVTECPLDKLM